MIYMKTLFFFQLQAKIKKLFQAERESNITACVAAWIKASSLKLSCFQPQIFTDGELTTKMRSQFLITLLCLCCSKEIISLKHFNSKVQL